MLISRNWLAEYVALDMPPEQLAERLMMAGLNHEESRAVGDDLCIDLEVTSNRPDCLGHIGVARETAVLYRLSLCVPVAAPKATGPSVETLTSVRVDCPELCPRYTARVIRGVRVAASPAWLRNRLATVGIAAINNVVDITNYVLMECGQPLHAFDLAKLAGHQIIVRRASKDEALEAINHKRYLLEPEMCVIADTRQPVALAGVMGGAESEVSSTTRDLLIESAEFAPMSIRSTARRLNLHSDSSYRFERGLDPAGIDWASRRCCELILDLAGGELAEGVIDVGQPRPPRESIKLRFSQLKRILGIDVPPAEAKRILLALGCKEEHNGNLGAAARRIEVTPPSWRSDLSREIDLVEEVARIHGYDQIPEDVRVPMATSHRTRDDRVLAKVRHALTAAGFDEAMTLSVVEEAWSRSFSPWTDKPPLRANMPVLRRADRLRLSLIPSLLAARQTNEALSNPVIELFEVAKVYLPGEPASPSAEEPSLPLEETMISLVSGGDYFALKGVVESLVALISPGATITVSPANQPLLDPQKSAELRLTGPNVTNERFGYLGELIPAARKQFDLRLPVTIAELRLAPLLAAAQLIPQSQPLSTFPAVTRDVNLVVAEAVLWADVERTVRRVSAPYAEQLAFQQEYRDANRLGPGKKSLLFTLSLRSNSGTLTSEEADNVRERIVAACAEEHGAQLRAG